MDYDEQDREVVSLLSKLREAESTYPVDMMATRRQSFVKQIAALGIGTGAAVAMKEAAKAAGSSSIPPIASTIVETALIVAIVAEATFVAFVNREKVFDLLQSLLDQPTVSRVTAAAESTHPLLAPTEIMQTEFIVTAEPTLEPTLVTATATAVGTPTPGILVVTEPPAAAADTSGAQENATPVPNGDDDNGGDNGNNGNHYGQTPAPERTKESGGGGGGGGDANQDNENGNGNGNRK